MTSELLQRVPPFVYSIFNVRYKTGRDYRVPPLNFFRHCATFFRIFFCGQTVPPSSFFDILQQTEVSKSPKGPPSLVFGTVRLFRNSHFSFFRKFFQKKFRIFLSSIFFDILQQTGFSKSWKGPPPFYKFKNLALFWALDIAPTLDVPVLFCRNMMVFDIWTVFIFRPFLILDVIPLFRRYSRWTFRRYSLGVIPALKTLVRDIGELSILRYKILFKIPF